MKKFKDLIDERKKLQQYHDQIYKKMIIDINMQVLNEIKNIDNFQVEFIKACAIDVSGEVVRNYFDMSDYNLTVDQLYKRIVTFQYDNDYDPLNKIIDAKKDMYNLKNSRETMENITNNLEESKIKIFEKIEKENGKIHKQYKDSTMIQSGKKKYKEGLTEARNLKDEVGTARDEDLQVDHVMPLATAQLYARYMDSVAVNEIKKYYNSDDNFAMLGKTANQCKGDAKVIKDGVDITHKASPEEITAVIVKKLEGGKNRKEETNRKLKDDGILDENGKVHPHIKSQIKEDIKRSQNAESKKILKNTDYAKVSKDAVHETKKTIHKIIIGQAIYYIVPPLLHEIKINKENGLKLDTILSNLGESSSRVIDYVVSKKTEILLSVGEKGLKKFLKNIFDILIGLVKSTIKKIMKCVRQLVITSIDAFKIALDSKRSSSEKMDAILKLMSGLVVTIVCEVLFEYIEKQLGIPEIFLAPFQMLTTILTSNFIMLMLEELDLFDIKHGYKLEKIKSIFNEEEKKYEESFLMLNIESKEKIEGIMKSVEKELYEIKQSIKKLDIFSYSAQEGLEKVNEIFDIDMDFDSKWAEFISLA